MGNRLVTITDYIQYIKNTFKNLINDIYVCNNATYTTVFYQWLLKYDKLNIDIRKNNYKYSDACDFNNIYLWMVPTHEGNMSDSEINEILFNCNKIKSATTELVPCNAVETYFVPFIKHPRYETDINSFISNINNLPIKIIISKRTSSYINNQQLAVEINQIFVDYFKRSNQKLGSIIDLSQIERAIYDTDHVENIYIKHIPTENTNDVWMQQGLSFAYYTPSLILAKDFQIFTTAKKIEQFQFPKLCVESLMNIIEIENPNNFNITNSRF